MQLPLSLSQVPSAPSALEHRVLSRSRRLLADLVAFDASPRRVVDLGRGGLCLEERFPEATVRVGDLSASHQPVWTGWPDVVWCDYALSGGEPPEALVSRLRTSVPDGALVAVVDAHSAPTCGMARWLRDTLGITPVPSLLGALRASFVPLQVSMLEQQGGMWRTLVFVGRKKSSLPGASRAVAIC